MKKTRVVSQYTFGVCGEVWEHVLVAFWTLAIESSGMLDVLGLGLFAWLPVEGEESGILWWWTGVAECSVPLLALFL